MLFIPNMKGHRLFQFRNNSIDFIALSRFLIPSSLAAILTSLLLISFLGVNFGVDFNGGSIVEIRSKEGLADIAKIRDAVSNLGLGDIQIQMFGSEKDVLIRVEQQYGDDNSQKYALEKIISAVGKNYEKRRTEIVGPVVSSELRNAGLIAVFCSILAIICYVWFRFEWQFAVGTVFALIHDIIITIGVFVSLQFEFDLSTVAALMTILGYSVNDTVVVSDRIRENLKKYKKLKLSTVINRSINEVLSRTLITSLTTLIGLLALYLFGGHVIQDFTFTMMFGVIIGTYSSIFVLAPILEILGVKRG
ncbi:MAG: protein translocase subunit SecF [Hyphomicrobiaceae bacterium]|nr:protein translocase subunit SecF [Hyphomicrobiaceae bacterium]